jgi:hypothetical protein
VLKKGILTALIECVEDILYITHVTDILKIFLVVKTAISVSIQVVIYIKFKSR